MSHVRTQTPSAPSLTPYQVAGLQQVAEKLGDMRHRALGNERFLMKNRLAAAGLRLRRPR